MGHVAANQADGDDDGNADHDNDGDENDRDGGEYLLVNFIVIVFIYLFRFLNSFG